MPCAQPQKRTAVDLAEGAGHGCARDGATARKARHHCVICGRWPVVELRATRGGVMSGGSTGRPPNAGSARAHTAQADTTVPKTPGSVGARQQTVSRALALCWVLAELWVGCTETQAPCRLVRT